MRHLFTTLLIILVLKTAFGQGSMLDKNFYSEAMDSTLSYAIYLPQGYDENNTETKYPVIYFLHGSMVDHNAYKDLAPALDLLIATKVIQKVIAVLPDGSHPPYYGSFYTDSPLYGNYETYIAKDLIKHIDENYSTFADKGKRAIAGHSMGAYGAMKMAVKYPENYCAVAAFSGPMNTILWDAVLPLILEENGNQTPYNFTPDDEKIFTTETFSMAGAFSPNLENPPYYVDFPVDENGEIVLSLMDKWNIHNPAEIARTLSTETAPALYFDCGTNDEFRLMQQNLSLADTLEKYNIAHTFESFEGNHTNELPNRAMIGLQFINEAFNNTPTNVSDNISMINNVKIYPNPAVDNLKIQFNKLYSGTLRTEVYNIQGHFIFAENINSYMAGNIDFEISNLATGFYFLILTVDSKKYVFKFEKR